jgi:UDP:flavonoid glycosyltransferase YjiC (YdhE family)
MRVLLVASPLVGHVLPLVPLGAALREAGHDVLLATAAEGVATGRRAGLDVRDVAPAFDLKPVFTRTALRHPRLAALEVRGRAGTEMVGHLFAAVFGQMADGVVALADEWHPDLVVHEPLAATGALAAARREVPTVTVDASLFDPRDLLRATLAHVGPVARRHGVTDFPDPAETLMTAPQSVAGARWGRPMRYLPTAGDGAAPEDLTRRGDRRRIIVTRSTVESPMPDALMSTVAAAADGAELDVVLVRPDRRVTRRPLPGNVRTADWLPFPAVFPTADGVVHHGGAGTLLTALAAGLPQLVAPGPGDRTVHAELVAARGAGLAVPAKRISRADLNLLVSDPSLRSAAQEVAAEMASMPHPRELVPVLERLAGVSRPAA